MTSATIILLLLLGALVNLGVAAYAARYRAVPAALPLALLMGEAGLNALLGAFEITVVSLPARIIFWQARYLLGLLIPPLLLIIVLAYTGRSAWLTRRRLAWLLCLPVLVGLLVVSAPYHQLFRYNFRLDFSAPFPVLQSERGIGYWLDVVYSYTLILIAATILAIHLRRNRLSTAHTALLLLGGLIPLAIDAAYVYGATPIAGYNLSPASLPLTGAIYAWALLRYRILDISPVARNLVMETIEDLVIVLDEQGRIVDVNPPARAELGLPVPGRGLKLAQAPPEWQALLARCLEAPAGRQEVRLSLRGQARDFDLTVSPLRDQRQMVGHLVLLHDITERKQVEQALRQRNRDLAALNAIVATITSSLALEQVLQHILDAVPRFFPGVYNAAVQLVDEQDGRLHTRAASQNTPGSVQQMSFLPGEGISGLVFQEQRPFNSADVLNDPRYTLPVVRPAYRSLLAAPLLYQDQALGALCITSLEVNAFHDSDMALLESLAGYAVIAVQNARLYEQTRRDAQTQTMLLREVNHRVKNNLVSVLSLLNIEMSYLKVRPAAVILNDLKERIKGLLVVHELLSEARWAPLPVHHLIEQTVQAALAGSPIKKQITLHITGELSDKERWLAASEATGLGLVMNELVTNTVKHAFVGRSQGVIEIQLRALPGEQGLEVRYRDDGPGWPPDVLCGQREHIGLGLIRSTVRDRLVLTNEDGAVATLVFR